VSAGPSACFDRIKAAFSYWQAQPFEVHDSPGFRWGYLEGDTYWKADTVISRLVEAVCRNGDLLLNFGPEAVLKALATGSAPAGKIDSVTLFGDVEELEFTQDATGLHVKFPADQPCDYAYALKITGLKLAAPAATAGSTKL